MWLMSQKIHLLSNAFSGEQCAPLVGCRSRKIHFKEENIWGVQTCNLKENKQTYNFPLLHCCAWTGVQDESMNDPCGGNWKHEKVNLQRLPVGTYCALLYDNGQHKWLPTWDNPAYFRLTITDGFSGWRPLREWDGVIGDKKGVQKWNGHWRKVNW